MITTASAVAKILANLEAKGLAFAAPIPDIAEAIAAGILDEIKTNGTVSVTVTSVSGVTTGPGVSGPGVGQGTIQ
jgi:hypothetical protein